MASAISNSTHIDPWQLPSHPLNERDRLPRSPGLYFAIRGDRLLYLGMSMNINKRWQGHHEYKNLKRAGRVKLHYLELPGWSRDRILKLESELIARYTPRFNDVGVGQRMPGNDRRRSPQWWVGWLVLLAMLAIGYQVYSPFRIAVDELIEAID